jgi:G3E family GTPase
MRWSGGFTAADSNPRHANTIRAYSYSMALPLEWERVHTALKELLAHHGERILRAKGILQIVGVDQPLVLQAVHHTLYPPDLLSGWAGQPRESRLVVIVDGIERERHSTARRRRLRALGLIQRASESGINAATALVPPSRVNTFAVT